MSLAYADFEARFDLEGPHLTTPAKGETVEALTSYINARLLFWLARTSMEVWGQSQGEAVLLRVAHERQLIVDRKSGVRVSGRVSTNKRAGAWAKAFSVRGDTGSAEDRLLRQTDWGLAYLGLKPQSLAGFLVTS